MPSCAIKWCGKSTTTSSYAKDGITFHRFPNDDSKTKEIWIKATHRDTYFPTKNSVICSRHFTPDCFEALKNNRRRLFRSSIPTLYLPSLEPSIDSANTQAQPFSSEDAEIIPSTSKEPSTDLANTQAQHFSSIGLENKPFTSKNPDDQNYNSTVEQCIDLTPRKRKMKRHIDHLISTLNKKKKDVKRLQDKTRTLKKKVANLQEILDTLTKKSLLDQESEDILKGIGVENRELIKRQQQKSLTGHIPKTKYSPEIRAFAITLHFYSPKAYDFVRKTFSTCLPCPSTLRKWYQSVDGQPGFTKEALNSLKLVAKQGNQIYATIVFDEMAIKSGIEYHPQGKRFYGHVNYGAALESDCQLEAKEALVFLLVPLNASFKIPIGYFLIKGITSNQKASLLTQAIHLIEESGIRVIAVIFDGCPANLSMARILGCTFDVNNLVTTFKNPCNDTQVAVFLDPAHMIKLVRNAFEFYGNFSDKDGQIISWQHLVNLHNLQTEEHFHLANRLRATHIFFKCKIMKVSLATQIFSKSVADALIFCKNQLHLPEFQATTGTIDFLKIMNDLFDILDSHVHGYDFKRAVNEENAACVTHKLDLVKNEILKLNTELVKENNKKTVKLVDSPRHTGFLGFCICIESAKHLIQELVLNKECPIKYLPLHKISQDHLEHFFGSVRSHGGSNNNPTARVFESIYKKLLTYAQIKNTGTGNCGALNQISVLHCTSALDRINITTRRKDQDTVSETSDNFDIELQEEFSFTEFSTKVVEYIAGYIVHALIKKIKCQTCIGALLGGAEADSLQYQKNVRNKLMYASTTVIAICRRSEVYIKRALAECGGKTMTSAKYNSDYFTSVVLKSFVGYDFFPDINFHQFDVESTNHLIDLASCVAKKYIDTRLTFITKNNKNPKEYVRKTYSKLIHFKNQ